MATPMFDKLHARSLTRTLLGLVIAALALPRALPVNAQTIDVSLNLHYANPADIDSGGTWAIVAKSSHAGIASLDVRLTNIDYVPAPELQAPRGTVNGNEAAGFNLYEVILQPTYVDLLIAQEPLFPSGGEEQGAFYGVGVLDNGAPNWPGKPPASPSMGPLFTSLTNVQDVPWAAGSDVFGNPVWNAAATLASGTFPENVTPAFHAGSSASVFTTVGTSTTLGQLAVASLSTIVRSNFSGAPQLPDYNGNGRVDAADYVLWRKGSPLADGNNDSLVNILDFNLWRANFGAIVGSGAGNGGAVGSVPEPASGALLTSAAIALGFARRRRR
jgi:hypothetical protein